MIFLAHLGCATTKTPTDTSKTEYQITLYVESRSASFIDPVNICVTIDDSLKVVDGNYSARVPIHRTETKFNLSQGLHQMVVTSKNGDAGLDFVFTVDKPIWFDLVYIGKNHFQLLMYFVPMVFM